MKRISKILATAAIVLAPWAVSGTAFAASTCQIGYTGPDSNNVCVSKTTETCTVKNNNEVTIDNSNQQLSLSGNGLVTDNTTGGSASTGSATNSSGATFNVAVNNGNCTVASTVPATTTTPTTPTTTTTPAGGVGAVTPTNTVTPTVLPNTSGDTTSGYLVALAGILGVGALTSYLVTAVYGRKS